MPELSGEALLLCPRCHSTRLVPLTYPGPEPEFDELRALPVERPTVKCAQCGRAFRAQDFLVRIRPQTD